VLGFTLAHRAQGDNVAIVRNEYDVELNLIFNANAGDPDSNILMDVPDKLPATRIWRYASRPSQPPSPLAGRGASDSDPYPRRAWRAP
jgi:hypothetical protein